MPVERETIIERPAASSETVVTSGSSMGTVAAIIVAVIAVIAILWLVNGGLSTNGDAVNVDLPNVTVTE